MTDLTAALASGFSILGGAANVTVPETATIGDDYTVVREYSPFKCPLHPR